MRTYRLVSFDSKGRVQAYQQVVCSTEVEVERLARAIRYPDEIEIWEVGALVWRLNRPESRAVTYASESSSSSVARVENKPSLSA